MSPAAAFDEFAFDERAEDGSPVPQTVSLRVIARDPAVTLGGRILTATVRVPAERLEPGPRGSRFHIVDYDAARDVLQPPVELQPEFYDRFADADDSTLVSDPAFRAQNVYAIAARTLASFEAALGRRLRWAFRGHQLYLVPHAFAEANAHYDPEDGAILFGYLPRAGGSEITTSLSHDVIAHETTHAILDGLRPRLAEPGLPDQLAFHEALADIVALLSVFSMREVVEDLLGSADRDGRIARRNLRREALERSALFTLAEQLGESTAGDRAHGLRRSIKLRPSAAWRTNRVYDEPHRRGEVLVAAVTQTLLSMWIERLKPLMSGRGADRARVAEEGAKAAAHLLHMMIRGIDYLPPVELEFEDVIDSVLKADEVIAPDDEYGYRVALRDAFGSFGIHRPREDQLIDLTKTPPPSYARMNFTNLRSDPDEVFRFIWDNAEVFDIRRAYRLRVESVRPSVRVGPDGLIVGEVVADYIQTLELTAGELAERGVELPRDLNGDTQLQIWGGGVLIFDQFGRAKYHQRKRLNDWKRQGRRLDYLVRYGLRDSRGRYGFTVSAPRGQRFASLHDDDAHAGEEW